MEEFTCPVILNGDALREEIQEVAGVALDRGQLVVEGGTLLLDILPETRASVEGVVGAHSGNPTAREQQRLDWRARLAQDIAWLENEIATAPAPGTTTSGNAVARLDGLIQHMKRVDRGLLRLARFVRDNTLDSEP